MHPLVNIAVKAARRAGEIIVRSFDHLDSLNISNKAPNDFVSEVDVKAEEAIIDIIRYAYPDHAIMAEESGYQEANNEYVWIIDPLDGTANYLHGFPHYSVSIAVQIKNRLEHAVIFDPMRQECFTATRGRGAQLNDRRIRVSKQQNFSHAILGTGFPYRVRDEATCAQYFTNMQNIFSKCSDLRRVGSAALDLAYVAAGRLDGYWEYNLHAWDIAASCLLVKEAGGLVSDNHGAENYL
jgi:myo-inositol-1(or 4)-monophosphatase